MKTLRFLIPVLAFALVGNAQTIQKTTVKPTSPIKGAEMFHEYCAVCHGQSAKGDGPAATALKKTPSNLTELAARNKGTFPEAHVFNTIQGDLEMPAHGSKDMPVWGNVFHSLSRGNPAEVQLRISNLTAYLKTIQVETH